MAERDRSGDGGGAGLTAEDVVAVVRVHLDRVHDAVRRTVAADGPDPVEVARAAALSLVDEAAARPLDADQATGVWYGRALALAKGSPSGPPPTVRPRDDRAVRDGSAEVSRALAALTGDARTAVLLRDAYDLPAAAVAAALGTDVQDAFAQVARARLSVPAAAGDGASTGTASTGDLPTGDSPTATLAPGARSAGRTSADLSAGGHADLPTLARLAEDRPVVAADATAHRHVLSCASCREVVQSQSRAARLLAGVVVVGPSDRARAHLLAEVEERARQRLPRAGTGGRRTSADVVEQATGPFALPAPDARAPADAAPDEPRRLLSPLLVVLSLVLAALAGVGGGLLLSGTEGPETVPTSGGLPSGVRLVSPQPSPPTALPSPPTVAEQRPRTTVVVVPPDPLPTPTPSPSPSPTPAPSAVPTVGVQPASGPDGTELTVTGTGFPPGAAVRVDYLDTAGAPTGSGADAVADDTGTFTTQVVAADPAGVPGPHEVVATAGELTARATFTVEAP